MGNDMTSGALSSLVNSNDKNPLARFLNGKIVLTVDDQRLIRMMVKSFLLQLGIDQKQVKMADDGDTAIDIIEETRSSLGFILLDWNMPRVPGLDVLRMVRRDPDLRKLPILMITAETREEQILQAVEEGVDGYLIKPFTGADLGDKMLNIIKPPEYAKLLDEAESLIGKDKNEMAISLLEKVLEMKPNSASARMFLGMAYKQMNDDDRAMEMYEGAVEKNPKFIKALNSLSEFLVEKGDKDKALIIMKKADQLSPLITDRKVAIGGINLEQGNEEAALKYFKDATKLEPEQYDNVVTVCLEHGNAELATEYLNKSVARKMSKGELSREEILDFIDQYNHAGIELRKKGQWEKAIQTYKSALEIDDENVAVHYNIGKAYVQGGNARAARLFFEKALAFNKKSTDPDPELSKIIAAELEALEGK